MSSADIRTRVWCLLSSD